MEQNKEEPSKKIDTQNKQINKIITLNLIKLFRDFVSRVNQEINEETKIPLLEYIKRLEALNIKKELIFNDIFKREVIDSLVTKLKIFSNNNKEYLELKSKIIDLEILTEKEIVGNPEIKKIVEDRLQKLKNFFFRQSGNPVIRQNYSKYLVFVMQEKFFSRQELEEKGYLPKE